MYFTNTCCINLGLNIRAQVWRLAAAGIGMILLLLFLCARADAATNNMCGGIYTNWPSTWIAISNLNDPVDSGVAGRLDFIGDSTNPCGFWTTDASYVYFRLRVNVTNADSNTFSDAHFVMIDVIGSGTTNVPDWAFAWDSKSNNDNHRLEMLTNNLAGTTWGSVYMADVDGNPGTKIAPPDFGVTNGDGYVRTVGGVVTTNLGLTTFIDFAASWKYLTAHTGLQRGQTWRIQFASVQNNTDHQNMDGDVAANTNPNTANSLGSWSASFVVPAADAPPSKGFRFRFR